jgi:hypothetical protein
MADELEIEGFEFDAGEGTVSDPVEPRARTETRKFFEKERETVFFSRQIEVLFENRYFHWITARALRHLVEAGWIKTESRKIPSTGGAIHLFWHRRYRYYRRAADELVNLVSEYADPNVAAAIGIHGEAMVLGGFAEGRAAHPYEYIMAICRWRGNGCCAIRQMLCFTTLPIAPLARWLLMDT